MPSLKGGGAERVISHLLQLWDSKSIEVHLALIYPIVGMTYAIPEGVKVHPLNCQRVLFAFWPCLKLIRQLKPDTVFSTFSHVNILLLLVKKFTFNFRLCLRECSLFSQNIKLDNFKGLKRLGYRYLYPKANGIICPSEVVELDLHENFPRLKSLTKVVRNPVLLSADDYPNPYLEFGEGPHLLMVGRLSLQKQCDVVLTHFSHWLKEFPDAQLWFVGEGECLAELEQLSEKLEVSHKVHFEGFKKNVEPYLKYCHLYILASRYEGYPNALLEALTLGCSVLVKSHPGGSEELLRRFKQLNRFQDSIAQLESSFLKLPELHSQVIRKQEEQAIKIAETYLEIFFIDFQ